MRQFFILLSLVLFLSHAHAQSEIPIIAISEGAIYAVNPNDGSAEMLVPASDAYGEVYEPSTLFSSEWLSPDGQYLAYRMTYPVNPAEPVTDSSNNTHRLFILDVQNGSFPRPINLGTIPAYQIVSVAWSLDGNLLYVLFESEDTATLAIIERENWQNGTYISPEIPEDAVKQTIFAIENGLVLEARGWMTAIHAFIVFDSAGQEVNRFQLGSDYASFDDFFIITPFTPLLVDGLSYYSLIDNESSEIRYQIDFLTGELTEFEAGYLPAMVRRANPANSLRISVINYTGREAQLTIRDAENQLIGTSNTLLFQAYGPVGDTMGSTFALSPDGQSLAYLENNALMLWKDGAAVDLAFSADVLVWAASSNIPIYDPEYFAPEA